MISSASSSSSVTLTALVSSTSRAPKPRSTASSEPARDVVLGALVGGVGEDLRRLVVLDEDPAAPRSLVRDPDAEEGGHVRDARGLLHVVRHDHDRVLALQVVHQVLD